VLETSRHGIAPGTHPTPTVSPPRQAAPGHCPQCLGKGLDTRTAPGPHLTRGIGAILVLSGSQGHFPTCSSRRALRSRATAVFCSGRPAPASSSIRSPRISLRRAATSCAGSQRVAEMGLASPFTRSASARDARISSLGVSGRAASPWQGPPAQGRPSPLTGRSGAGIRLPMPAGIPGQQPGTECQAWGRAGGESQGRGTPKRRPGPRGYLAVSHTAAGMSGCSPPAAARRSRAGSWHQAGDGRWLMPCVWGKRHPGRGMGLGPTRPGKAEL